MTYKPAITLLFPLTLVAGEPCRIEIVDRENGWPVPLVEIRSTHESRHVSDNLGLIAIDEPDLLNREVWFHVKGHGYGVAKDGFGSEGVRATLKPGGTFRIEVERRNLAKRLGRLTGAGLYAEGEKLGIPPLLPETGTFGCDSVLLAKLGDNLIWMWGDTTLPDYPLGVFHMTAATTPLAPLAKFEPPLALSFTHFRSPDGKPRGVAKLPGDGPTWLTGLTSFDDTQLVATYSKIKPPLDEYEVGLCVWDPSESTFVAEKTLWKTADGAQPPLLKGHTVRWRDAEGNKWLLFGDPFPTMRCPDDFESWKNPSSWEAIPAPAPPRAAEGDAEIRPHRGSIAWNAYRKCWTAIFTQHFGKPSAFGEIWYAKADSPLGPWRSAVKVLSHDNYTFYNPRIHPELTPEGASFLLFEGTYTVQFADHARPTPRHDYNQILYRLDLDDVALQR